MPTDYLLGVKVYFVFLIYIWSFSSSFKDIVWSIQSVLESKEGKRIKYKWWIQYIVNKTIFFFPRYLSGEFTNILWISISLFCIGLFYFAWQVQTCHWRVYFCRYLYGYILSDVWRLNPWRPSSFYHSKIQILSRLSKWWTEENSDFEID